MTAALQPLEPRRLMAITGLPFKLGSGAFDQATRVVHTSDGGYLVGGLFSGTVDFDPSATTTNLTSVGDSNIFVARYSATSRLLWARQFGGDGKDGDLQDQQEHHDPAIDIAANPARGGGSFVNGYGTAPLDAGEYLNALQVDAAGNVYLGGDFVENFDADPSRRELIFNTQRTGYYNGFLIKLSAAGNLTWARQLDSEFTSTVAALAIQTSGDVVATGLISRDLDLIVAGTTQTFHANGRADGYVMDLSVAGAIRWVGKFGSDETDKAQRETGNDLALDSAGNIYVVGTYANDAIFSGTTFNALEAKGQDDTDGFLAKYSATGRIRSVLTFTGGKFSGLTHVAVDNTGSLIVTGYFQRDDFDADPGPGVINLQAPDDDRDDRDHTDAFVEKISAGRAVWVQQLSGEGTEFIDGLAVDSANRIALVGSFYDAATFGRGGPAITSTLGTDDFNDDNDTHRDNSYDAFVWSLTDAGSTTRVRTFGSSADDFGMGVAIGSDDSVLFAGRFSGTVDFDPDPAIIRRLRGLNFGDGFVSQLDANGDFLA